MLARVRDTDPGKTFKIVVVGGGAGIHASCKLYTSLETPCLYVCVDVYAFA